MNKTEALLEVLLDLSITLYTKERDTLLYNAMETCSFRIKTIKNYLLKN